MKNFILLLLLICSASIVAQGGDRDEKIKAFKTAYFTEALSLTTAEAEKFWPIYNKYDDSMDALRSKERAEVWSYFKRGLDEVSEEKANTLIDKIVFYDSEELKYKQQLYQDLKKVISSRKILKLRKAEHDFKRRLLEEYKKRRRD
ncbi:sensor of ECF-type sigma factor [Patiriisocius hiemis]|uniref:Sensor of ECF-type sigma factor n=1 Tax=Patiriisocius hiemis TaxID=3075604 RepID=A0ABU2YG97_9FLAO|nr:sensor of ECF-type sigma factor [Constantimarinum sp. W242]MDT0556802.1 sensor of ECF-type sigma factor [Constantimarinum sp. W242]